MRWFWNDGAGIIEMCIRDRYREDPENAYKGSGMGIIYRDPEDSLFDETELLIVMGTTIQMCIRDSRYADGGNRHR